jgi:hypothetical protein
MYLCAPVVWEKRSISLYWLLLDKKGSSNIGEQQALITPVLELLSDYEVIILGNSRRDSFASGELGTIKLAIMVCHKPVKFILRVKQGRYIQSEDSDYILLSYLGLLPEAFTCQT